MKTLSGAKPCVFPGIVAPGVAEVGSRFPRFRALIWQSCRQKLHRTACSKSSICTSKSQKSGGSEHFWKMRWAKCAQDCSSTPQKKTGTLGAAQKIRTAVAARVLVDLVRRSCYAGLQLGATNALAQLRAAKQSAMLRRSCKAGLQLEASKRIVKAARREELGCRSYRQASWEAVQKEVAQKEAAQRRSSWEKRYFSEEVA